MSDSDEEGAYCFYGTEINRDQSHALRKAKDDASTRALPVWQQEATDAQGRRRFHGAFTGGFSAGYFNSVGSEQGWTPSTFRSSRSHRSSSTAPQSIEQFLDQDELDELQRTNLQTAGAYDTFGAAAADAARRQFLAAQHTAHRNKDPATRGGAGPHDTSLLLLPDELVMPVVHGTGVRLLQRMGWRHGKGIGGLSRDDVHHQSNKNLFESLIKERKKKWGPVAGIGPENTPLFLIAPKNNTYGLGYDPFDKAEEFRAAYRSRHSVGHGARGGSHRFHHRTGNSSDGHRPGRSTPDDALWNAAGTVARPRGVAFGTGVLEEDDSYGIVEDYVSDDVLEIARYGGGGDGHSILGKRKEGKKRKNAESVMMHIGSGGNLDERGIPLYRGPKIDKALLGDKLALQGYAYEVQEAEEDADDDDDNGGGRTDSLHGGPLRALQNASHDQKHHRHAGPLSLPAAAADAAAGGGGGSSYGNYGNDASHMERRFSAVDDGLNTKTRKSFIHGFVLAEMNNGMQRTQYFPPPKIPKGYIPSLLGTLLLNSSRAPAESAVLGRGHGYATTTALQSTVTSMAQPQQQQGQQQQQQQQQQQGQQQQHNQQSVPPPPPSLLQDDVLKREIDQVAFYVAKHGSIFEDIAKKHQEREGVRFFMHGGPGSDYYNWKVSSFQRLLCTSPHHTTDGQGPGGVSPLEAMHQDINSTGIIEAATFIGQRRQPLTTDERGAMLGEESLPKRSKDSITLLKHEQTPAVLPPPPSPGQAVQGERSLARSLLNVAKSDRERLLARMNSMFVRGQTQDTSTATEAPSNVPLIQSTTMDAGGLRPGVKRKDIPPLHEMHDTKEDKKDQPEERKIVTVLDLSRPLQSTPAITQNAINAATRGIPVRYAEEWIPDPLLCKRLDVPEPTPARRKKAGLLSGDGAADAHRHGLHEAMKDRLAMSKFKMDNITLPDTMAAYEKNKNAMDDSILHNNASNAAAAAGAAMVAVSQKESLPADELDATVYVGIMNPSEMERRHGHATGHAGDAVHAADAFLKSLAADEDFLGFTERPLDIFGAIFADSDDDDRNDGEKAEHVTTRGRKDENIIARHVEHRTGAVASADNDEDEEYQKKINAALRVLKEAKKKESKKRKHNKKKEKEKRSKISRHSDDEGKKR